MAERVEAGPSVLHNSLDIEQIRSKAQNQWLPHRAICQILQNHKGFHITSAPHDKPPSGSLFLFDRKVQKHFRNDGHNWTKKKDGKQLLEGHRPFKVEGFGNLNCYYARGKENRNFLRRCYWMPERDFSHIVLVHYLEETGRMEEFSCVKGTEGEILQMPNSQIDGSLSSGSRSNNWLELSENTDTGLNSAQPLERENAPSGSFHEKISAIPGIDLVPTQSDKGKSDNDAESLSSSSHPDAVDKFLSDSFVRGLDSKEHSQIRAESKGLLPHCSVHYLEETEKSGDGSCAEEAQVSVSCSQGQESVEIMPNSNIDISMCPGSPNSCRVLSVSEYTDTALLTHGAQALEHENAQSEYNHQASFGYHFDPELQQPAAEQIDAGGSDPKVPLFYSNSIHESLSTILDIELDPTQLNIGNSDTDAKLAQLPDDLWTSLDFTILKDDWESFTPCAESIEHGSLPSSSRPDTEGKFVSNNVVKRLDFGGHLQIQEKSKASVEGSSSLSESACDVTSKFHEQEVNLLELMDYDVSSIPCEGRLDIQDINAAENYSDSAEANLILRFDKILCSGSSSTNPVTSSLEEASQLSSKISSLLKGDNKELDQMLKTGSGTEFSSEKLKDQLLQKHLKEKLHVWILQKVAEGGNGPSILDEDGQGVLHLAAALGYDWALEPTIVAGVSVDFRDVNGWTALHWAAFCGREHTVASLISLGAATTALTHPSPKYPSGSTPADQASINGHKGIAEYLAHRSLDVHISCINLDHQEDLAGPKAVQKISEISAAPLSLGNASDGQSQKDLSATSSRFLERGLEIPNVRGRRRPLLDVDQILLEAQHRWLHPAEICEILQNYKKFHISAEPPNAPPSGSLFLFDRKVLQYFRKDGHNWRKKKDGKTVKEAHEKLKVGSVDVLHCYHTHGEENENFQRRSYWMLEEELSHVVFFHYLEVKMHQNMWIDNSIKNDSQTQLLSGEHDHVLPPDSDGYLTLEGKSIYSSALKQHLFDSTLTEEGFKKLDSFNRWMSKELGDVTDVDESHMQSSSGADWETVESENGIDVSSIPSEGKTSTFLLDPSLSQNQLFSIVDFSPNWTYVGSKAEVLITGRFLKSPDIIENCKWSCMFGEVEVPADVVADGVLRCYTATHEAGWVHFYVTCSNRLACSEVREFEYRVSNSDDNYCDTIENILLRFDKLLTLSSSFNSSDTSSFNDISELSSKINSLLKEDTLGWDEMLKFSSDEEYPSQKLEGGQHQKQLKEKLCVWLLQKVAEGGKGPSVLDGGGQGVLHFAAALGYDWAFEPTIIAGVSVNFRDVNGWTALHWAAYFGRERAVASLLSLGAAPGLSTDPSPKHTLGRTPADLASAHGHKGIAGYLAECSLSAHLSALNLDNQDSDAAAGAKAVQEFAERTATPFSLGNTSDGLSLEDSLAAVRNATQAFSRIFRVYRVQSFQKRQLKEYGDDKFGMSPVHAAAIRIQNKFRSWKGRKHFLLIREKIVKIQAHVRGHQVRKNYRKIIWCVGIVENVILRWRRKGSGLRGFKKALTEAPNLPENSSKDGDYDFLKEGRKQTEERMQKALARVKSMAQYPEGRDQYRRLLNVVTEIQEKKVNTAGPGYLDEDLIDFEELMDIDNFMSTAT